METMVSTWFGLLMMIAISSLSAVMGFDGGYLGGYEDRERLIHDIMSRYDKSLEPFDSEGTMRVNHTMNKATIVSLEKGVMEISFWNTLMWTDPRLAWNSSLYGGVSKLAIQRSNIWNPDIHVLESVDPYSGYPNNGVYASIDNAGKVIVAPPELLKAACPYNEKDLYVNNLVVCSMMFSLWVHPCNEIDTFPMADHLDDVVSLDNRWEVVSTEVARNILQYVCCPETYCHVKYKFTLKRADV